MIERLCIWLAWHMPARLAKWAFVRVATAASVKLSDREMGSITCVEALWEWPC